MSLPPVRQRLFSRGNDWPEAKRVADLLRTETTGGLLLLIAALTAIVWANIPWSDLYYDFANLHVGPASLDLDLSLAHWAADGLLAVFFFVVGMELKHEFVHGELRNPAKAAVPVVAAVCGVAVPAIAYYVIQLSSTSGVPRGWAIPTATDIAFALAVLAVIGTHLPSALRSFLLTLAVVDDLIAITIIAVFYSDSISFVWLGLAVIPLALFGIGLAKGKRQTWIFIPLALLAWYCVYRAGVHATIAGVLLGLLVPVKLGSDHVRDKEIEHPDDPYAHRTEDQNLAHALEHRMRPLSAGVCVPIFAFFSAGVTFVGGGFGAALRDPVTLGVIGGLVIGKIVGVFGATFAMAKFTKADLDDDLAWLDVLGLSMLAGIGFTVSLLIGELAFGAGSDLDDHVKVGVLMGSLIAAILAAIVLRMRDRVYRRIHEEEERDDDGDGIPDCYGDPVGATRSSDSR